MKQIAYDEVRTLVRTIVAELFLYRNVSISLSDENRDMVDPHKHMITLNLLIKDPEPEYDNGQNGSMLSEEDPK